MSFFLYDSSTWQDPTPPKHSHPTLVAVPKPPIKEPASPGESVVDFESPTKKVLNETNEVEAFK